MIFSNLIFSEIIKFSVWYGIVCLLPSGGTPVAQLVKRWSTDLAAPSSNPTRGEIFSTVDGVSLHTAFH